MAMLEARWKVLSDLLVVLRSRGADVPAHVVRDLRLARSLIEAMKASPGHPELAAKAEELLLGVESFLLAEAEFRLGPGEAGEWARKLEEASLEATPGEPEARFRPGLPRDKHWVRVRISEELPEELLERLAREEGVSTTMQPDGFLLVSGEEEKVKSFVKRLAEHFRSRVR